MDIFDWLRATHAIREDREGGAEVAPADLVSIERPEVGDRPVWQRFEVTAFGQQSFFVFSDARRLEDGRLLLKVSFGHKTDYGRTKDFALSILSRDGQAENVRVDGAVGGVTSGRRLTYEMKDLGTENGDPRVLHAQAFLSLLTIGFLGKNPLATQEEAAELQAT